MQEKSAEIPSPSTQAVGQAEHLQGIEKCDMAVSPFYCTSSHHTSYIFTKDLPGLRMHFGWDTGL